MKGRSWKGSHLKKITREKGKKTKIKKNKKIYIYIFFKSKESNLYSSWPFGHAATSAFATNNRPWYTNTVQHS